jgi:hypothetical protein
MHLDCAWVAHAVAVGGIAFVEECGGAHPIILVVQLCSVGIGWVGWQVYGWAGFVRDRTHESCLRCMFAANNCGTNFLRSLSITYHIMSWQRHCSRRASELCTLAQPLSLDTHLCLCQGCVRSQCGLPVSCKYSCRWCRSCSHCLTPPG